MRSKSPYRRVLARRLGCILVLDHDEASNFLTSMVIRQASCAEHMHVSSSIAKALRYLDSTDGVDNLFPDLFFADPLTLGTNATEFIANIQKRNRFHARSPIVVMLTSAVEDALLRKELGDTILLAKPLTPIALQEILFQNFRDHFDLVPMDHWRYPTDNARSSGITFYEEEDIVG